jgi:thioredoxin reductase (NADPH)
MEEATFLTRFARSVTLIHRRDEFRASKIMLDRARERENIHFKTPFVPEEFIAGDDGKLRAVRLRNADTGETEEIEVGGAFIAIGHIPRSELVQGQVDTDEEGYVLTEDKSTRTKLAGVFAVGDLVDRTYRQAVTAAGTGCMGALDAEWYLRDTPPSPEAHWLPKGEPVEVAPNPSA